MAPDQLLRSELTLSQPNPGRSATVHKILSTSFVSHVALIFVLLLQGEHDSRVHFH